MRRARLRDDVRGFNLLDLMATLTVLATVAAVAAPALQGSLEASRLRAAGWGLVSDLHRARRTAITENRPQRLTVSANAGGTTATYVVAPTAGGSPTETRELGAGVSFGNDAGTYVEFDSRGLAVGPGEFRLRGPRSGNVTVRVRSTGLVDLGSG